MCCFCCDKIIVMSKSAIKCNECGCRNGKHLKLCSQYSASKSDNIESTTDSRRIKPANNVNNSADFYTTKDVAIIYSKGKIDNPILGLVRANAFSWFPAIKHKDGITPLNKSTTNFYCLLGKKEGVSRLTTGVITVTMGTIAGALTTLNGLGYTCNVYLELSNGAILLLRCHEDYFKYIRSCCKKGILDTHAEQKMLTILDEQSL